MSGERAYNDLDNFSIDNEPKQKQERGIPGSRMKSTFSGKVLMFLLMFLIFILLSVFFILLVTGVIKCSETNEKVEGFQAQVQTQVSHAMSNVSEKSDVEKIGLHIQEYVSQMGARVMEELSRTITGLTNTISRKLDSLPRPVMEKLSKNITDLMNTLSRKLDSLPRPGYLNRQCPDDWTYFNGSCYLFSGVKASWSDSQKYCSIQQSHLLVIDTIEEQYFVALKCKGKEFWFGLHDRGTENKWEWVDGTDYEATAKFWAPGEPNNANSGEDCAQTDASGRWNDNNCSRNLFFICEQEARSA